METAVRHTLKNGAAMETTLSIGTYPTNHATQHKLLPNCGDNHFNSLKILDMVSGNF